MRNPLRRTDWLSIVLLVAFLEPLGVPNEPIRTETHIVAGFGTAWTNGSISDGAGLTGTVVSDLDGDGKTETVSCTYGFITALNYFGAGHYDTVWYSENYLCQKLRAADRDADGTQELYVGTSDGKVHILHGRSHRRLGTVNLPDGVPASDFVLADADSDGNLEIVVVRADMTLLYDAKTLALEWQATAFGGGQVAVGNIDAEPFPEIVINGDPGRVLDARKRQQEYSYLGGFGRAMQIGDMDGDGQAEIALLPDAYSVLVIDGETLEELWRSASDQIVGSLAVADVDGDGLSEVITGSYEWAPLSIFRGRDGVLLGNIPNQEYGAYGIGVGDANDDQVNEVVWGAGADSTSADALFVGSWISQTVQWKSTDLDGPLFLAAGDVDLDGRNEIVMASRSTNSRYDGGTLRVYDGSTHELEWSTFAAQEIFFFYQVVVGQLDADEQQEILVSGSLDYNGRLRAYDAVSQTVEWQSPSLGHGESSFAGTWMMTAWTRS
jgi:hypothetical protein